MNVSLSLVFPHSVKYLVCIVGAISKGTVEVTIDYPYKQVVDKPRCRMRKEVDTNRIRQMHIQ